MTDHAVATTRESPVSEYYGQTAQMPYRRARPRRRGGLITLAAILLVLAAIAVIGDRIAAEYAARELRAQVVAEMSDRGVQYQTMDVGVGGFPFLTQVANGHYDEITIEMGDVRLPAGSGAGARLPWLNVVARGVDADTAQLVEGTASVIADEVTGTAVVSFQTLQTLADFSRFQLSDVTFTEANGALQVTGSARIATITVPISAQAVISVVDGEFDVRLRDAKAVGVQAPQIAKNYLDGLVERSVTARLPPLPFGLTLDRVSVAPDGLSITATGRNVPLVG